MNSADVKYVNEILREISNYFRDEMDGQIPIDVAIQFKRYIRNINDVIEILEAEGDD